MEGIKTIKINTLSGLAYAKFNLDNGEAHKNVRKSVLFSLISVYNMITKREEHTDDSQLRALCMDFAHPPTLDILLTIIL